MELLVVVVGCIPGVWEQAFLGDGVHPVVEVGLSFGEKSLPVLDERVHFAEEGLSVKNSHYSHKTELGKDIFEHIQKYLNGMN